MKLSFRLVRVGAFVALSAALFAAAIKAGKRWPAAKKALVPLVVIIVLALSASTFAHNRVWQDETRLWEDVVRKSPENARAYNNLCFIYLGKGMADQAIEHCMAALRLIPAYLDARINLGTAHYLMSELDEARRAFEAAIEAEDGSATAHFNLGCVLDDLEDLRQGYSPLAARRKHCATTRGRGRG